MTLEKSSPAEAMGWTPLHEAIAAESHDAVQLLMNISSTIGSKNIEHKRFINVPHIFQPYATSYMI